MKKTLIAGLGQRGKTLSSILESNTFDTLDPFVDDSNFKSVHQVNVLDYDKIIISTSEKEKNYYINLALKNRWNVLVEKPLLFSPKQINQWEKESRSLGIHISVAYSHKYEKLLEFLRQEIQENTFGDIYEIQISYLNGTAENIRKSLWRDSEFAVAVDLIPHTLDLIFFLLEKSTIETPIWNKNNFENKGLDSVRLHGQVSTTSFSSHVSYVCWKNTFRLEVFGSKAYGIVNSLEKWGNQSLEIFQRKSPPSVPKSVRFEEVLNPSTFGIEKQWSEFVKNISNRKPTDLTKERNISQLYENSFGGQIFLDL